MQAAAANLIGLYSLAVHLGVAADWLRDEATAGRLPCVNADGRFFFDQATVERAIAKRASDDCADDQEAATRYLTAVQVADRLNVKVHQISKWTSSGTIPRVQIEHTVRYNWAEVEEALAERAGFKTIRPHRCVDVLTLAQTAAKLEMTKGTLRRLANEGDVPSYRNGTGKDARLFFSFDDLWAAIVKLQNELTFQEFNRMMSGKAVRP